MVVIKHLDSGNFIRATEEGVHVESPVLTKECKFVLKKHGGGKVSFRLLGHSGALSQTHYLCKPTIGSSLCVASHLPGTFLGSHFIFVSSGEYLYREKMFSGKLYLAVDPKTKEISCDATEEHASRFQIMLVAQFDSLLSQKM